MELSIRLVCPQCQETFPLHLHEMSPGHRQNCSQCQTPGQLTPDSLELFSKELHQYCNS